MGGRWSGASSSTGPMGTRIGGRRIFNPDHSSLYQSRCGVEENEVEGLRLMEVEVLASTKSAIIKERTLILRLLY